METTMSTAGGVHGSLERSFAALKQFFAPSRQQEAACSPAKLVLFAEHAAKDERCDIALECLKLYFSLEPPANQFLIRAYLCEAVATVGISPGDEVVFLQATGSIVKAVSIAKKSECYHFLVYNASVVLWQVCRPFHKPGSRKLFTKPLQSVVRALDDCKQQDFPWRLELLIGLVLSQMDAGLKDEAVKSCSTVAVMAKKRVPSRLLDVLKMQAYFDLGDGKQFEKEMKSQPEYAVLQRLYKIKCAINQQGLCGTELEQRLRKVFTLITKAREESSGRKTSQLASTQQPPIEARPSLLIELGEVCLAHNLTGLTEECMAALPPDLHDPRLHLLRESLAAQVMVQRLGSQAESYSKSAVQTRLQSIGRMEEIITQANRLGDPELTQHVCVVQWNLSLPLLQPNLRQQLLRPLTAVASALEEISSLLQELRSTVHFELAKICADQSQLNIAIKHLEKASGLDVQGSYTEQLGALKHRLTLRAQLYEMPDNPVDLAAMIIEQASSSSVCGELQSVLVKAGDALAPDCFIHTLGKPLPQDGAAHKASGGMSSHSVEVLLEEKASKLTAFELTRQQAEDHAKKLGAKNDRERCRLWADLAKTARKQNVWDVASSSAVFCLVHDDLSSKLSEGGKDPKLERKQSERLSSSHLTKKGSSPKLESRRSTSPFYAAASELRVGAASSHSVASRKRGDRDVTRLLAEIHCLYAECLVYQLRQEGLELGMKPLLSVLGIKGLAEGVPEQYWSSYTKWSEVVTQEACKSFLRAAELGCMLGEPWLVCNAACYLLNYHQHWVQQDTLTGTIQAFRPLLALIKKAKLHDEALVVVRVCTALAGGLMQKWTPKPVDPSTPRAATAKKKAGKPDKKGKGQGGGAGDTLNVDPESGPELKEALEVCEYAMGISPAVPLSVRSGILAVWVQCKQLMQQPIASKTYGIEERADDKHILHCRAMVAIEMISRMGNKIWDFPSCPTLQEVFALLNGCEWSEYMDATELETWTRVAGLALKQKDYHLVCQCAAKAVDVGGKSQPDERAVDQGDTDRVVHELLALACSMHGLALAATAAGNTAIIRQSLEAFLLSARFAAEAVSMRLVLEACGHYWASCQSLVDHSLERALLREPLTELLQLVAALGESQRRQSKILKEDPHLVMGEREIALLADMYGAVFQVFVDKCEWEEGLQAVEDAMWHTPRSLHRHLAQHKLVFKSQTGKNIEGDMIRFQEEPEDFVASLWHKAAVNATQSCDQLKAYQNAIQTLQSAEHDWQRVGYLLEFGEWLYLHHFPVEDAVDQLLRATHTLLNLSEDKQGLQSGGNEQDGVQVPTPVASSCGVEEEEEEVEVATLPLGLTSARQLEALLRVHVMMLQLVGRAASNHRQLCIAAVGYCSRMLQQAISSGTEEAGLQLCQLPHAVEEWGCYTLPEQLFDLMKSDSSAESLNKTTITKPMLLLHYLGVLERELAAMDLHALVFPVLSLQLAVAGGLLPDGTPLTQLLHMRLAKLCLDLNLQSAAAVHSEKAGPGQILNPDDLARSQVDIQHFRAKQQAVEREESKRVTSGRQPSLRVKSSRRLSKKQSSASSPKQSSPSYAVAEEVVLREVWVQQAHLLLQQGQYQVSRELLQLSLASSQVFGDPHTELQAQLGLASLALAEKNSHKAIQILTQIQSLPALLEVWLGSVLLLVEAVWGGEGEGGGREQCVPLLEHALGMAKAHAGRSRNEAHRVEHAESKLKSRLALCKIAGVSGVAAAGSSFTNNCQVLSGCVSSLLSLGRSTEAAELLSQHASVLKEAGKSGVESEMRHKHLLEAVDLYQQSVNILNSVYNSAKEFCQSKSEEVVLPVQKVLVKASLDLAELLVDVFSEHTSSLRLEKDKQQQKSSVEKLIDEYVRESPDLSPVERAWQCSMQCAVDRALGLLSSAHTLAQHCPPLKCRCIYIMGRCFHLLSKHSSPDPALQWKENSLGAEERESEEALGGNYSTLSTVMRKNEAEKAETEEARSLSCVAHACHLLAEAVALALKYKQWDLAAHASLEIVDCCGCFDPPTASLYLSLHQSLVVSMELHELLREVMADPSASELGALLEQNSQLTASCNPSPALEANIAKLNSYTVYQRLDVSSLHLEHVKNFPSHFRFIVLQHSPDKCRLFAGLLVPPQPPPPAPKKGQPPSEVFEVLEPVVSCCEVSPSALSSLLELVGDYKANRKQTHLRSLQLKSAEAGAEHDSQFADVVAAMESYLYPALGPITTALKRESGEKRLSVVLLADSSLLQLPLEALGVLQAENINSVTRDLSLQLLQSRISKFIAQDESGDKKRDKFQSQPDTLLVNTANFKYVLDPRKDLGGTEDKDCPTPAVLSEIHTHVKLTAKWTGHAGTEQLMSVDDWPGMVQGGSGLLLLLSERLLAHFSPAKLLPLSLHECSLVLLLDHMQTSHSVKMQSKLDFHKSAAELKLEQPLVAVKILSLTGVSCVTANQWYTTAETNTSKILALLRALLSESSSIGTVNWGTSCLKKTLDSETADQGSSKETDPYNCVVYGLPHLTLLPAS